MSVMKIPERLRTVIEQLQIDCDHSAERGKDRVDVDFDDLNKLLSWLKGDPD